ncbi:hypothetical protein AX15_007923 [Amanita polypyramis BW_CC]|nr:hypothetical protein AX15_007923 [Amanita polypyramis BW_CC]
MPNNAARNNARNQSSHVVLTGKIMATPATHEEFEGTVTFRLSPVRVSPNPRYDVHPDLRPSDLFIIGVSPHPAAIPMYRFIRKTNKYQMLVFVDGACAANGLPNARAGWAVSLGPQIVVKGRLEPDDEGQEPQTNNRAELRAVLVALILRHWRGEGFTSIVIAGDSEYVVKGYCKWLPGWKGGGSGQVRYAGAVLVDSSGLE